VIRRREFLGAIGLPAAAAAVHLSLPAAAREPLPPPGEGRGGPDDEDFWHAVGRHFTGSHGAINLNNGGVSPSPDLVQRAHKRYLDQSNDLPPFNMWRQLEPRREVVRERLAREFGCDPEEVAITRNASESLQTCQLGLDLEPGDEILTTDQDYPRMLTTFRQRERREGVRLREIALPVPAEDPAEVVARFERAITPRTRLILVCHVVNLTGQILPVADVVALARRHGIPVVVDGAHALAHFAFRLDELDCDYYGSSLHKWLFAPHGTGFLYVRREKIGGLWPLMAAPDERRDDVRKFEEIGTHPCANFVAIGEALSFHQSLGAERKERRLRHLRDRWAKRLVEHDRVRLHTSLDPRFSCGIATVEIEGVPSTELARWLWHEEQILVSPIRHPQFEGIRVSPSVYTRMEELDRFCDAMEHVVQNGLPA